MREPTLNNRALLNYSLIALPLAFAGLPLYIHMPDFYTREFGINIGLFGIILFAIRLFDGIQDPLIGYLADKWKNKTNLLLNIGFLFLFAGLAGLFLGPPKNEIAIIWFISFMTLATCGFSIISININKFGGFWKTGENLRVSISVWRERFGLLGLLLAVLTPELLSIYFEKHTAFIIVFVIFIMLLLPSTFLFQSFLKDFNNSKTIKFTTPQSSFFFITFFKGHESRFFLLCFLSFFSASIPAALVLFFIRDYLNAEPLSGLFLALYFVSGAAFMPIWTKLSKKYSSYTSWLWAMTLSVATFMGAALLSEGDILAYSLICITSGAALGADLALPPAILAERIRQKQQEDNATQHYAFLTLLPKLAMAFAVGISFICLEKAGFKASQTNSDTALNTLLFFYAVIPCMIKAVSILLLWLLIKKGGYK